MVTHMKTTIELSDSLLDEARRIAVRDGTTLRDVVEAGLRRIVQERRARGTFTLRDARVGGRGVAKELRGRSWDDIRDLAYEGRGT